jgi:hypothetical protein
VVDGRDVATPKPAEAHSVPVERNDGRSVDDEAHAASVELADRDARRLDAYNDPAVFSSGGGCTEAHGDNGGAKQHQPEPSHARMLVDRRQRPVWCV